MSFKHIINTLTISFVGTVFAGAIVLPQPFNILLILKISAGIMLINALVEPLMHFFTLKKYFLNQVFITFILYLSTILFFILVVFAKLITKSLYDSFTYSFLWALFSSIIVNIMYYTR